MNEEEISLRANKTVVDYNLREMKAHGTETFPIGIYLDDFSDFENGYICWHWHEEVQVTMIIEGEFWCQLDGKEIKMCEREVIFINTGIPHQIKPCIPRKGKLYSFIWRAEFIGGNRNSDIYRECVTPLLDKKMKYVFWDLYEPGHKMVNEIFEKIFSLYEAKQPLFQLKIQNLVEQFWIELFEIAPSKEASWDKEVLRDEERVKEALQYIYEHYQENVKLEDIAQAAFVSKSELCRGFKRTAKISPMEFLMQFRIKQATILLKQQDLKIADIAERTGFCSPSHFGSNFSKMMGCTPREYRKRY